MLELPETLRRELGPEMKMDVHWVDVKLRNGEVFRNLVVRGGRYLTGRATDPDGEGSLPFAVGEIAALRRHTLIPWPFC